MIRRMFFTDGDWYNIHAVAVAGEVFIWVYSSGYDVTNAMPAEYLNEMEQHARELLGAVA